MQPIVPKGNNINQYPKALDSSQVAVREASATLNESAESVEATRNIIESIINDENYSKFFSGHFGTKPLQAIKAMHFPQGHTVKQGGGTGNTLSIAQEMMEYKNPAPTDYGLKIEVLIALLNSILRIPAQQANDSGLRQKRLSYVEEAVFKLDSRPIRESMVAAKGLEHSQKPLSRYTHMGVFKLGAKYGYVQGARVGNTAPVWLERPHSAGFNIILKEVINHYEEVYQIHSTTTTPRHFWEANSKKRLGVEIDPKFGKDNYTVKVFNVDPATGAPRGRGRAVARAPVTNYHGNPGFLLAKVKQNLFPEVYLLSDGVAMHEGGREEHYKDQLLNAKNMWEGIPDKAKTPIACVIEQSFSYPHIKGQAAPKNPSQNTTIAVNSMKVYLQPTGIEEAMKRILDVSHPAGNAVEKWATTDLFQNTNIVPLENHKYKYLKYSVEQNQWTNSLTRYTKVLQVVYTLLDNPHIYAEGLSANALTQTMSNDSPTSREALFGKGHWMVSLPTPFYSQYLNDALKIFSYAGWPQATPQLIFSAPIDEEQDLNMLINMFKNYMNEHTTASPGQMYVPESFNGRLDSVVAVSGSNAQSTGQAGLPNYNFGFSKIIPSGGPHAYKESPMTIWGGPGHSVVKKQRYHKGAKTVVTQRVAVGTSAFPMPPTIKPKQGVKTLTGSSVSQVEAAGYVAGGGLVIALGIAAIRAARKL